MLFRTNDVWVLLSKRKFDFGLFPSNYADKISKGQSLMSVLVGSAMYCVGFVICADVSLTYVLDCYQDVSFSSR